LFNRVVPPFVAFAATKVFVFIVPTAPEPVPPSPVTAARALSGRTRDKRYPALDHGVEDARGVVT